MKRVLYLCQELSHYRLPILNLVAEECDLTVVCSVASTDDFSQLKFKIQIVDIATLGPFFKYKVSDFYQFCAGFDVVIGLLNLRFYQIIRLCFSKRSFRLILWGIGVTGSYNKKFNSFSIFTLIRALFSFGADSLIFYSAAPVSLYKKLGFSERKIFIANNTVDNKYGYNPDSYRDIFLFCGTLYKEKGVEELICSFYVAYQIFGESLPCLIIIGDGPLRADLEDLAKNMNILSKIVFVGSVYDIDSLKLYFDRAIISVSPKQAGLSVLTSMSFGVPFVTLKDAITGGEILNIKNEFNGFLLENHEELSSLLVKAACYPSLFAELGRNAFEYYISNRTPRMMANEIINSIYS